MTQNEFNVELIDHFENAMFALGGYRYAGSWVYGGRPTLAPVRATFPDIRVEKHADAVIEDTMSLPVLSFAPESDPGDPGSTTQQGRTA